MQRGFDRNANYAHFDGKDWKRVSLASTVGSQATAGHIAPLRYGEELRSVVWGVGNKQAVELLPREPKLVESKGMVNGLVPTEPLRSLATEAQWLLQLQAAGEIAAALSEELDSSDNVTAAIAFGLGEPSFTSVVAKVPEGQTLDDLSVASLPKGSALGYRHGGRRVLAWIDASGKPIGSPISFGSQHSEHLAMTMSNDTLVMVWAERADEGQPLELKLATAPFGGAPSASQALKTSASAFAPTLLAEGNDLLIAWAEGDDSTGAIFAAKTSLQSPSLTKASKLSNTNETNAREPVLAGTPKAPKLAYLSKTKPPGGGIQFAELECSDLPRK